MKVKKIERNSLDPKEKKEIKRKYKEVGHKEVERSRKENRKTKETRNTCMFEKINVKFLLKR